MTRRPIVALLLLVAGLPATAHAQSTVVYRAFGDSITFGTGAEPNAPGYPARLERMLNNQGSEQARVANHGLGSETTVGGVSRIDRVLELGGDVLLLMEGTNDVGSSIGRETTLRNLDVMANKAVNRGFRVVHATVIPRYPAASRDSDNRLTTLLNYAIRDLASRRASRQLVDPFAVFLAQPNLFRDYYANIPGDRTGHPNPDGYELLARVFADVLLERDTVPPVPLAVQPANGATGVARDRAIVVDIKDFGSDVDTTSAQLLLNGEQVESQVEVEGRFVRLRHAPPERLLGIYELSYQASDLAVPPNTVTRLVSRFRTAGTSIVRGDFNQDGQVDGHDLVLLGFRFGARRGQDGRYATAFDLDSDGVLDGEDLAVVALNFGRRTF